MNTSNQNERTAFENAFPKTCGVCNKTYNDHKAFLEETTPLRSGDLSQGPHDSVLSYRNCSCGSTMTIKVSDMRDYSEAGKKRREEFRRRLDLRLKNGEVEKAAINEIKKEMGLD